MAEKTNVKQLKQHIIGKYAGQSWQAGPSYRKEKNQ